MKQEISSGRPGEAHTVTVLRERGGSTSLSNVPSTVCCLIPAFQGKAKAGAVTTLVKEASG